MQGVEYADRVNNRPERGENQIPDKVSVSILGGVEDVVPPYYEWDIELFEHHYKNARAYKHEQPQHIAPVPAQKERVYVRCQNISDPLRFGILDGKIINVSQQPQEIRERVVHRDEN